MLILTSNVNKLTFPGKPRKGAVLAGFQAGVRDWVRAAWRHGRPDQAYSVPALSEVTGIPLPALYRIENLEGKASEKTIRRIADALKVPRPGLTLDVSGLTPPVNALGWVLEAQSAIEQAAGLLRGQTTGALSSGKDPGDLLVTSTADELATKAPRRGGPRKKKAS